MSARSMGVWVGLGLALSACEPDAAKDKAKQVGEQAVEQAVDKGKELADDAVDKGKELADDAVDKGKELWAERKGELSDGAKAMLAQGASASGEGVEAAVHKGEQLAPVAFDITKTLRSVVDSDVDIEPIVQRLDDPAAQAELDARIADMPRVETIEGLDVGFKDMTQWDAGGRATESAYLVLWRADTRLYGLVYRSRQRINIDTMVTEAPRLIALVQGSG